MKRFKIEGIPNFAAKPYNWLVKNNPCIKDYHKEVIDEICSKVSSGRLLDIGTGPGYVPIEIAKIRWDIEAVGIDLSSEMIAIAAKNAQAAGLSGRVSFKVAGAAHLPFEDEYFDTVISTLSFHHWLEPAKYIDEIYRVLKKNGRAYIYDLRRDTSADVDAVMKKKYGWFLSFLFLKIVRLHSSIPKRYAEDVLSSVKAGFSEKTVKTKGVIISLQLLK